MQKRRRYMDYNATAPLSALVKAKIIEALDIFGNPSSVHEEGRKAKSALNSARQQVARLAGIAPENLYFTSGASEAAAILLSSDYILGQKPIVLSHLYISAAEHPAILGGGRFLKNKVTKIALHDNGIVNSRDLTKKLAQHNSDEGLPLVAIQAANNESGVLQPLEELCAIVHHYGGLFVVDAVQILGKLPFCFTPDKGDFFIGSGHKFGGLKGCGFWGSSASLLAPKALFQAGGQEKGLRSGTESLLPILSAGFAAEEILPTIDNEANRLAMLRNFMEQSLKNHSKAIKFYGQESRRLPNVSLFAIDDIKAETLQIAADLAGFAISAGAACSSGKIAPSPLLEALGKDQTKGAIRVSLGRNTTKEDVEEFCAFLINWLNSMVK